MADLQGDHSLRNGMCMVVFGRVSIIALELRLPVLARGKEPTLAISGAEARSFILATAMEL